MTTSTRPALPDEPDLDSPERRPERPEPPEEPEEAPEEPGVQGSLRRLLGEVAGTFALTFVAAGAEVIAALTEGEVSAAARAAAPGLTVLAMIYAIGDVSGAHLNPAVTLAFALRGAFPWARVPLYWLSQTLGACGAALLLLATFGPVADLGATRPRFGVAPALTMEVALTWLLVTVILGTATRHRVVGPNAALAVGATITLCGLFAAPVSGASMNPARSFGPALVAALSAEGGLDALADLWLYLLGPVLGAVLACLLIQALKGPAQDGETKAAEGA